MFRGIVLLALLLGACSAIPPDQTTQHSATDPSGITNFELRGRLGMRGSGSATLNWSQAGDFYRIVLLGPFGSGRIEIEGDKDSAVWRDNNGKFASTNDPEQFLLERLGWTLPLDSLRFWIRGLASPEEPIDQFKLELGQLRMLRQNGWLLRIDRYQDVRGLQLPGRLVLEKEDQHLTLLIGNWTLR